MSTTLVSLASTGISRSRHTIVTGVIVEKPQPYTKSTVAELTVREIEQMRRDELISAIRGAQLPLLSAEMTDRLRYRDRDTLERILYLARRACRNQGY